MFIHTPPKLLEDYQTTQIQGKRHYIVPNGVYPSITTVLGSLSKYSIDAWKLAVGEEEANKVCARAAGRGTNVHSMCEDYLNNKPLSCKAWDALELFRTMKLLLNRINNIQYQECVLFSDKLKIAGRVDCVAEFDGVLSIIDFKTSSKIKTEDMIYSYFIQETFYALAYTEMFGTPIKQIVTLMGVSDEAPQLFVKNIRPYIKPLVDLRKGFTLENI